MYSSTNSLFNSSHVNNKLKSLTVSLKDTSKNLKSLDYLLLNPSQKYTQEYDQRQPDNFYHGNKSSDDLKETTKSISKIEQSLNNISSNQNRLENEMKRLNISNTPLNKNSSWYPPSSVNPDYIFHKSDPIAESNQSVENKLKDAQQRLRNERIAAENRNETFIKGVDISTDLKTALIDNSQTQNKIHQMDKEQIDILTRKIVRTESDNASLKFELESLKRQILNESGAKSSLMTKLESSKTTIRNLEDGIGVLKKQIDLTAMENEMNKKKADSNSQLQERLNKVHAENEQLKKNSYQCSHLTEIEELRKAKDKAERKQASLQDQISETLKQVDSKQSHISRLMDELRDSQEQLSRSKLNSQDLDQRFYENQNELRHQQQISKDYQNKMENLERTIIKLEVDKNNGFSIRDDEIERFENQVARMKHEIEKLNGHVQENSSLINDLQNDNDTLRQQLDSSNYQTDALRKEMESLLKARSIQDEILKRRENDNQSYHNENVDLKTQLEAQESTSEKFKYDAEVYCQEINQARETIAVQEERLSIISGINLDQKEELTLLKSELSNQKMIVGKLENQISSMNRQIIAYREGEENIDNLKRQLSDSQKIQEKVSNDVIYKTKKMETDRSNHVKKLEQLLEAERGASKVLMNKCDRQIMEIKRLHDDFWYREQLVQEYKKKYLKVKDELEQMIKQEVIEKERLQTNFNEEVMEKEQELTVSKDKFSEVTQERDQIFRWIIGDLDGVVEVLSHIDVVSTKNGPLISSNYLLTNLSIDLKTCPPTSSALSTLGGLDASKTFIDIKSKISWIRSEINMICNFLQNHKDTNNELLDEINLANEKLRILESEKSLCRDTELDEARKCIANLKIREKNEMNLQLKCDRLQEELHQVRQYLNATLGEHCNRSSYY